MSKNIKNYLKIEQNINKLFYIYFKENKKNYFIREKIFLLFYKYIISNIVRKLKYCPRCLEKKDLINEGSLVIDDALFKYIYGVYNCDFTTFTKSKIKQQIDKLIRLSHSPSVPIRIYNKNKKEKKPNQNTESLSSDKYIQKQKIEKYEYNPYYPRNLNPHQLYIKQINHENFLKNMKKKLNPIECQILIYSYGISTNYLVSNYPYILIDQEISLKLNITKKQIYKYREKAILKLKYRK